MQSINVNVPVYGSVDRGAVGGLDLLYDADATAGYIELLQFKGDVGYLPGGDKRLCFFR